MNQFYVSIIFIGIICISVAFVWIFVDRRRVGQKEMVLDEKREKIIQAIEDAEEIVIEMNKFSDYIAEKVEEDGRKLENLLSIADEKIELLQTHIYPSFEEESFISNTSPVDLSVHNDPGFHESVTDPKEWIEDDREEGATEKATKGKIIPLHQKYSEVIALAGQGLNETDIAKTLNMGKGEIQLVLGLRSTNQKAKTG